MYRVLRPRRVPLRKNAVLRGLFLNRRIVQIQPGEPEVFCSGVPPRVPPLWTRRALRQTCGAGARGGSAEAGGAAAACAGVCGGVGGVGWGGGVALSPRRLRGGSSCRRRHAFQPNNGGKAPLPIAGRFQRRRNHAIGPDRLVRLFQMPPKWPFPATLLGRSA